MYQGNWLQYGKLAKWRLRCKIASGHQLKLD